MRPKQNSRMLYAGWGMILLLVFYGAFLLWLAGQPSAKQPEALALPTLVGVLLLVRGIVLFCRMPFRIPRRKP